MRILDMWKSQGTEPVIGHCFHCDFQCSGQNQNEVDRKMTKHFDRVSHGK